MIWYSGLAMTPCPWVVVTPFFRPTRYVVDGARGFSHSISTRERCCEIGMPVESGTVDDWIVKSVPATSIAPVDALAMTRFFATLA